MRVHQFCPRCGGPLGDREVGGRARPACSDCRYVQFSAVSLGVGGVVTHDGRVFMIQRAQDPGRGRWTIPGGYVEADETFDDACVREIAEETGLDTRVVGLLGVRHRPETADVYAAFHLELVGTAGAERGDPEEIMDMGWFDEGELDSIRDLAPLSHELALLGLRAADPHRRKVLPGYTDTQRLYSAPGGLTDPPPGDHGGTTA